MDSKANPSPEAPKKHYIKGPIKFVAGNKPSEQFGTLGVLGSIAYGLFTGDWFSGTIGCIAGGYLRFRDQVDGVISAGDHLFIAEEAAQKKNPWIPPSPAVVKTQTRLDPKLDKVKEQIDEAMQKQLDGKALDANEEALLAMAIYIQ